MTRYWFLLVSAMILLAGCVSIFAQKSEPLRPGETVYLVGPERLIHEEPSAQGMAAHLQHPWTTEISGVALSWFDEVQVIENDNGRVRFERSMARHGTTVAWAPESAFRRDSDFLPMKSWATPGTYRFCNKLNECYTLHISRDAVFSILQAPHPGTVCALAFVDDFSRCSATGKIYAAPGYLEFRGKSTDDIKDFFVDYGNGKICRIGYSVDFFECSVEDVSFQADVSSRH